MTQRTLAVPNAARLAFLAATIAIEAPMRQGNASVSAVVDWDTINEIRKELETAGLPWKEAHKMRAKIIKDERFRRRAGLLAKQST